MNLVRVLISWLQCPSSSWPESIKIRNIRKKVRNWLNLLKRSKLSKRKRRNATTLRDSDLSPLWLRIKISLLKRSLMIHRFRLNLLPKRK